jgi:hypothetical protein
MRSEQQPRHPVPERGERPYRAADMGDTVIGEDVSVKENPASEDAYLQPQPTWEPEATAPRDGRDVIVRWGEGDAEGRVVHWKDGRWFNGRRWLPGGRWAPSDSLMPLTMEPPTHWLKPPVADEPESGEEPAAA